jgi:peptide-methionine (R)-S-oxide reductase
MKSDMQDMPDEYWRQKLTPEQYRVLRAKGTEVPGSGALLHNKSSGMYQCAACGADLFSSDAKFDSGSGWPSFCEPANAEHVDLKIDDSHGMSRTEVLCKHCGGHLGHVFDDGPADRGGKRYCVNSVALQFNKNKEKMTLSDDKVG